MHDLMIRQQQGDPTAGLEMAELDQVANAMNALNMHTEEADAGEH